MVLVALSITLCNKSSAQNIYTVAGNSAQGFGGDNLPATTTPLYLPSSVALGPNGTLYICDSYNQRIRLIDSSGNLQTLAGNGFAGYNGNHVHPATALLNIPQGICFDTSGALIVADAGNNRIRKIDFATNYIDNVAGTGVAGYTGDGGNAQNAKLDSPVAVIADLQGRLYVADAANNRVRRINANGTIVLIAGNGNEGYSGDNGPATAASLNHPCGLALDAAGNLYIADQGNNRIRKVSGNTITTVAGNGIAGFTGDNNLATQTELNHPSSIAFDAAGNLFIADQLNNRIRKVDQASGIIQTVVGNGTQGYSGNGQSALNAQIYQPTGLLFTAQGALLFSDQQNEVIRIVNICNAPNAPIVMAAGPTQFCSGGYVNLEDSDPCPTCTYYWSNGIAGVGLDNINVYATGTYTCMKQDSCGISGNSNSISVQVVEIPTSSFSVSPNPACFGHNITINYNGNAPASATYLWDFTGANVISGSGQGPYQIQWNVAGPHPVSLQVQQNGCISYQTVMTANVNQAPIVSISPSGNQSICPGQSIVLTASGATSYQWNTNSPLPSITVSASGTYTVTGTAGGCSAVSMPVVVTFDTCQAPVNFHVNNVSNHSAVIYWNGAVCAAGFQIYYKGNHYSGWQYLNVPGGTSSALLTGLESGYNVLWKIRADCGLHNYTNWSPMQSFYTLLRTENDDSTLLGAGVTELNLVPNPAAGDALLVMNHYAGPCNITLSNMMGALVWSTELDAAAFDGRVPLPVANLPKGLYLVTVVDANGKSSIRLLKQ